MAKTTFVKNQKVVVNIEGEFVEGTVKSVLKNGLISVKFPDGDTQSFPPSEVVDYTTYKKKNEKPKSGKSGKSVKEEVEVDEDELDWGDLDIDEDEEDEEEVEVDDDEEDIDEDELSDELDNDLEDDDSDDEEEDDEEEELELDDIDEDEEDEEEVEVDDDEEDIDEDELSDELDNDLEDDDSDDEEEDDDEEEELELDDIDEDEVEDEVKDEDEYDLEKPQKSDKKPKKTISIEENSWFEIGDDADEKFMSLPSSTKRFWLNRGSKTILTIITPKPVTYREHRVKISGRVHNLTCLATSGLRCPLCEIGNPASPKKAFYVIDHTKYFSKNKNKEIKHSLAIWTLGTRQYAILKAAAEKYFKNENINYRGLRIEVRRSSDRLAPNCGDIFFIEGVVKSDIFKGEYDKKIEDLINDLKPLDEKILRSKLPVIENESYDD